MTFKGHRLCVLSYQLYKLMKMTVLPQKTKCYFTCILLEKKASVIKLPKFDFI